jgi:hypothetical protein
VSWLVPDALVAGAAAALVVAAIHFIARGRPRPEILPTARFVPPRAARAQARTLALSDVALLAIRLAAVGAIALGVAGPLFARRRADVARMVLVDHSRDVGSFRDAIDSARAYVRPNDVLVVFDSAASRLASPAALQSLAGTGARGSLSAALAAATRIAASSRIAADSIELFVISPFSEEEGDSATAPIRALWPGRIRAVPLAASPANRPARVALSTSASDADDPVVAGLALAGYTDSLGGVRLVRGRVSAADTAWARAGGAVLHWPANDSAALWPKRATIDAVGGVASATGVVIARLPRLWSQTIAAGATVLARWVDGEAAASEHRVGTGCIRDVSVLVDPASDVTLRPSFARFAAPLVAVCGGDRATAPSTNAMRLVAGTGPLATTAALRGRETSSSLATPWLIGLGALLLAIELVARRPSPARARVGRVA